MTGWLLLEDKILHWILEDMQRRSGAGLPPLDWQTQLWILGRMHGQPLWPILFPSSVRFCGCILSLLVGRKDLIGHSSAFSKLCNLVVKAQTRSRDVCRRSRSRA